ncbi:MAG: single-stranded DNA-binding protein [Clostridia bacterium]|nr:single-stranded DNA-binding protein [Clostridia bacterium]
MGYQKIVIAGNIGKTPEIKYTPQGKAVCAFSVAVTEGIDKEHTEWFAVEVWEKTAEAVAKYCDKGSRVLVEGRLKTRKWTDKDGGTRYSTDLKASRVEFLGSKSDASGQGNTNTGTRQESASRGQQGSGTGKQQQDDGYQFSDDSEIPF